MVGVVSHPLSLRIRQHDTRVLPFGEFLAFSDKTRCRHMYVSRWILTRKNSLPRRQSIILQFQRISKFFKINVCRQVNI